MKKIIVALFVLFFASNQASAAIINPYFETNTYFFHTTAQYTNLNYDYLAYNSLLNLSENKKSNLLDWLYDNSNTWPYSDFCDFIIGIIGDIFPNENSLTGQNPIYDYFQEIVINKPETEPNLTPVPEPNSLLLLGAGLLGLAAFSRKR